MYNQILEMMDTDNNRKMYRSPKTRTMEEMINLEDISIDKILEGKGLE